MERKQIRFSTNRDAIDSHLEKLYKKIEFQAQLHSTFLNDKREIGFVKKDNIPFKKNNFKINFSGS
jgi:hypothetical protein